MANMFKAVRQVRNAFFSSRLAELRSLGNKLMEWAALENNKTLASIAMISYSLHKLGTKSHIAGDKKWLSVRKDVIAELEKASQDLEHKDLKGFEKRLKGIVNKISKTDANLGYFARGVYEKARVKYASTAYSMGLSLSQAAELTGAGKKDLLEYIGGTKISDREESESGIGDRLKKLKKLM